MTKIIFMGAGDFSAIILEKLLNSDFAPIALITKPDQPVGRKQIVSPPPAKKIAEKFNLPIYQPKSLIKEGGKTLIKSLAPNLIIVADYGKIIPKDILDIPKFGTINVHPSLLPKYRGPSPIQSAILNGEEETGVSVMLLDEEMDHGAILANSKLKMQNAKLNCRELLTSLGDLGGDLLIKTLPKWLAGEIRAVPQNDNEATYTKLITKEDGKIDWRKSAIEIERQVRAFDDWPGSWCEWQKDGKTLKIKIIAAGFATNDKLLDKKPGTVYATDDKIYVACKTGAIEIIELQIGGKKKTTAKDFLRGYPQIIGSIL